MFMDLFQRFALGEIDAFETLVRRFQGDIYAWIVRIVRDPGIAEDLTVETLWRAYRARKQFRPDGNFAAWSRRIATNLALDHLRRKRPEQKLVAEPAGAPPTDHLVEQEIREKIQQAFRLANVRLKVRRRHNFSGWPVIREGLVARNRSSLPLVPTSGQRQNPRSSVVSTPP
jgi:RNA polymerase sigma factor (sigma-70 family)